MAACTDNTPIAYLTEAVSRGAVVESVSATGEVSALIKVNVGSQVSGTVAKVYVDFNSAVKKGDLLLEIDPRLFAAALGRADAAVAVADAAVDKAKVGVMDAERTLHRMTELSQRKMVAQADVDTAEVNRAGAIAALKSAEAQLLQARADREQAAINLAFTKIRSPIDGTVIDREVDAGQTVAASFQVATLFTIANDLSHMQILASIDEADIGKVKDGMAARFSVDAYANESFKGKIREVRQAPTSSSTTSSVSTSSSNSTSSSSGVVTYAAVIDADNPDRKLRQGMTARVTIVINEHKDVLRVPSAALRYKPPAGNKKAGADAPEPDEPKEAPAGTQRTVKIYRLRDGKPRPVVVHVGISDGRYAEILSGLEADDVVVMGEPSRAPGKRRGPF